MAGKRTLRRRARARAEREEVRELTGESTARVRMNWPLAVLLAVVFAVKIIVLVQLGGHPLLQPQGELDTATYVELARTVAEEGPLGIREPFYVSPLYVFFLALIFKAGGTLFIARLVQVLLGTIGVLLLCQTARRWFGARSALAAGALAGFTGLFTFYEILILHTALDPFLTACALYLISRASAGASAGHVLAAGVSVALFALNRPNVLVYAAAVAVFLLWSSERDRGTFVRPSRWTLLRASVYLAGVLLILAPNAIRNYLVSGEAILVSSHGGLNFHIGNNPSADGRYQLVPGITPSIAGQVRDSSRLAEAELGRSLAASEVSKYFYARAWAWIVSNPWQAAKLSAWKLVLVLNRANLPLNYSYDFYVRDEHTFLSALLIGPWLLIPLGIVGLLLRDARVESGGFWIWGSFIPIYAISVAAFFVSSRYRMPLLVPLCATSGAAMVWAFERIRQHQTSRLVLPGIALIVTGITANWQLPVNDGRGDEQRKLAVWLIQQGRYGEAQRYVDRIVDTHPHPGVLHFRVGEALASANRLDDAIEQYLKAIEIVRDQPAVQLALGQALIVRNRGAEAIAPLRAAYGAGFRREVSAPWLARAFVLAGHREQAIALLNELPDRLGLAGEHTAFELGSLALELGVPAQAERWFQGAISVTPARADAHEQLGVARLLMGEHNEAVTSLEEACRLDPSSPSARLNLAVAYAESGRIEEARATAREAWRLDPDEPRTAALLKALSR